MGCCTGYVPHVPVHVLSHCGPLNAGSAITGMTLSKLRVLSAPHFLICNLESKIYLTSVLLKD